jgi:hypothetical protein
MSKKNPPKKSEGVISKAVHAVQDAITGHHSSDQPETRDELPAVPDESTQSGDSGVDLSATDQKKIEERTSTQPSTGTSTRAIQNHPKFSKFTKGN